MLRRKRGVATPPSDKRVRRSAEAGEGFLRKGVVKGVTDHQTRPPKRNCSRDFFFLAIGPRLSVILALRRSLARHSPFRGVFKKEAFCAKE